MWARPVEMVLGQKSHQVVVEVVRAVRTTIDHRHRRHLILSMGITAPAAAVGIVRVVLHQSLIRHHHLHPIRRYLVAVVHRHQAATTIVRRHRRADITSRRHRLQAIITGLSRRNTAVPAAPVAETSTAAAPDTRPPARTNLRRRRRRATENRLLRRARTRPSRLRRVRKTSR